MAEAEWIRAGTPSPLTLNTQEYRVYESCDMDLVAVILLRKSNLRPNWFSAECYVCAGKMQVIANSLQAAGRIRSKHQKAIAHRSRLITIAW